MRECAFMKRRVHLVVGCKWLAFLGCGLVSGCGGVSDLPVESSDAGDAAVSLPVALAGPDRAVETGTLATLDGRASHGAQLRFEWTLISRPSGSKTELSAPRESIVRFLVDVPGSYVARLIVISNVGTSAPAFVMITGVSARADAGGDAGPREDAPPSFDGGTARDAGDASRPDAGGSDSGGPTVDVATDIVIGDSAPRDATVDPDSTTDSGTAIDARDDARDVAIDKLADSSGDGARDAELDVTSDAREAGDGRDGVLDTSADAGPLGCGSAPPLSALGNYRGVSCGALEISDVVPGDGGTLYLVSNAQSRVVPWSATTGVCSNPILLGAGVVDVAYSRVNRRIYVGYDTGAITAIDPDAPNETPFARTPLSLRGLATAGSFVFAIDVTSPWVTHYVFDPLGNQVASKDWNYWSHELTWSEVNHRMYFFRDDTGPNDLHFEELNCATGAFAGAGETPYHGAYDIAGPIRVSPDGNLVLIGGGEIYDAHDLHRVSSLPGVIKDAAWLPNGKVLVLREAGTSSLIEQRGGPSFYLDNAQKFDGAPIALRSLGDGAVVVTSTAGAQPSLTVYHENVDGDGDGVPYAQDAFPLDRAASVDSDHDGFPDAWNAGQDGSGSSLTLDAFPLDSACHLASQGQSGNPTDCDIVGTVPSYTPASILFDGTDVLYLHDRAGNRIFRYSTAQSRYLNPFVPLVDASLVSWVGAHGRLYLAHDDGAISRIDVAGSAESEFTTLPRKPHGLSGVGNFLFAADPSGAWATHYTFGADASLRSEVEWNYYSREYAFSSATARIYFFRDNSSPNDVHWETIDQSSGQITGAGESPYHGEYVIEPPIRVSQNGARVLLGPGDVYDGGDLNHRTKLPVASLDAAWLPDHGVVVLGSDGILRWYDALYAPGTTRAVNGTPLRVFWTPGKLVVVTLVNGKPAFETIPL
jgi:hypothetical protein